MKLRSIKLNGVRNLAPLRLEPGPRFNVLFGDNGQGKTNFLEAIYALCTLRSFRTSRLADLIAIEGEGAHLEAILERGGLDRHYQLGIKPRGRIVRLDSKVPRPIAQYFGDFNVVLFAPEDLQVPRGSPSSRRRFLDRAVFNRSRGYLALASSYEKALKNRNRLLKDSQGGRPPNIDVRQAFDSQLATLGARLTAARRLFIEALSPRFTASFASIGDSDLEGRIRYQTSTELPNGADVPSLEKALSEAIEASLARDLARGATSVGPHRDDLLFTLAGQPAATFASQGQLRALVLAWKTAEMTLLEETHDSAPILLLDDVSSELDDTRNQSLFAFLRERNNQCFITTTAARHVLLDGTERGDRIDFQVVNGTLTKSS